MALKDIPAWAAFVAATRGTRPAPGTPEVVKLPDDVIATRNGVVALGAQFDQLSANLGLPVFVLPVGQDASTVTPALPTPSIILRR